MRTRQEIDAVVVGAGVIGLAAGRALALQGREVIVLERHRRPAAETSARNSGVIHSGIYYPPGSLKARLCVRGREVLYAYCQEKDIAHRRCGKVVVAQHTEVEALRALWRRGAQNGVADLEWLDAEAVRALEPQVACAAGLWSPSTGIVDVHEFVIALQGDLEAAGGHVAFDSELESARRGPAGWELSVRSGTDREELGCRTWINAGGLHAIDLLRRIYGYPPERIPPRFYAKGNYFDLRAHPPFRHLVYPMPDAAGLGVHATLDLTGRVRFGPDVEWVDTIDYDVEAGRAGAFYAAIRRYWPALADGDLSPAYAGIRPKLVGPGSAAADFSIETPADHGLPGLVNLLGIESPGLTSSLAIAEILERMIDGRRAANS